jgi:hypothetical protein
LIQSPAPANSVVSLSCSFIYLATEKPLCFTKRRYHVRKCALSGIQNRGRVDESVACATPTRSRGLDRNRRQRLANRRQVETDPEAIAAELRAAYERGKTNALVVVAEGAKYNAEAMSHYFAKNRMRLGFDLRATTLGHVQRGGVPGAFDRLLAARLGAAAIDQLAKGDHGVLVGLLKGEIATTPLAKVVANKKPLDLQRLELAKVLAK